MPKIGHYYAICAEVARLLDAERRRRKLTKYAVSQRSGVSEPMLSLMEKGLRQPSLATMLRIADGMGVDLPVLIKKAQATVLKKK
jgi:transcriptional regulator with XRE-family HTH domain